MTFLGLRADGGEMCHLRQSSKDSLTNRESLSHMLSILAPHQHRVFAPLIIGTLWLCPLALPVSNSDQSVRKELAEEDKEDIRQKANHDCVCATKLQLLQPQHPCCRSLLGIFPVILNIYHPGNEITSLVCFTDYKLIYLLALISQICCVWWDVRSQ